MKENTINIDIARPSDDAIHLGQALYNTYIQEDDIYLHIPVIKLCSVLNTECDAAGKKRIKAAFDSLNEPILMESIEYRGRTYQWKMLQFFSFEKPWNPEDTHIDIIISELYLHAMKHYVKEPFLDLL